MSKDIKCLQREFFNAVRAKKTSIRRKLMELNSLANAHNLILLPYQAQLSYMSQVVEERRKVLQQIQADADGHEGSDTGFATQLQNSSDTCASVGAGTSTDATSEEHMLSQLSPEHEHSNLSAGQAHVHGSRES